MPYMFGWHPGFTLPCEGGVDIESFKLSLGVDNVNWYPLQNGPFVCPEPKNYPLLDGAYRLCEEEIYKNDTMIFTGHKNSLTMTGDCSSYRLDLSWSENMPYLCVWKEDSNEAKFVCLEPWSDVPADGITPENFESRNMRRLAQGESDVYTFKFALTK